MREPGENENLNPQDLNERTESVAQELAASVSKPFPLVDLLRIAKTISDLKERAETAETLSMTDPLTGIPNRRFFDEQLSQTIKEAERKGLTFYLASIDFDNFKSINTSYGWAGGDEALKLVSELTHREEEPISRTGGDEFGQIISPTSEKELIGLAERYHRELAEKGKGVFENVRTMSGKTPVPVGISIGFARWQGEKPNELKRKADTAASEAKRLGKGVSVLARTLTGGEIKMMQITGRLPNPAALQSE